MHETMTNRISTVTEKIRFCQRIKNKKPSNKHIMKVNLRYCSWTVVSLINLLRYVALWWRWDDCLANQSLWYHLMTYKSIWSLSITRNSYCTIMNHNQWVIERFSYDAQSLFWPSQLLVDETNLENSVFQGYTKITIFSAWSLCTYD